MAVSDKDLEMIRASSPTGGALGALSQNMFSDDELLYTHPLDMTDGMLQAAQVRINESPEFADKYRATTDYKPLEKPLFKRAESGSIKDRIRASGRGGLGYLMFDKVTGRLMHRKIKGINF